MIVLSFPLGELQTNTYIVKDKHSFIIDPEKNIISIINTLEEKNITYIINTHGHFDHISGNRVVKNLTNAKIIIHEKDKEMLNNPLLNLSYFIGEEITSPNPDIILKDEKGSIFPTDMNWEYINLPGHSEGSIVLLNRAERILFSGDIIFSNGIGRTDIPSGNIEKMKNSLEFITTLEDDFTVYPGHGECFKLREFKINYRYFI